MTIEQYKNSSSNNTENVVGNEYGPFFIQIDESGNIVGGTAHPTKTVLGIGENHVGEVGGSTVQIAPTITVDTAAYTIGDVMGGKLTLTNAMRVNGGTGLLQSMFLIDWGNVKPSMELLIFNADPTASTLTDNAPIVIHADDKAKLIRRMSISSSDFASIGPAATPICAIADLSPGGRVIKSAADSRNLYACLVATAANDMVAATDLSMRLGLLLD